MSDDSGIRRIGIAEREAAIVSIQELYGSGHLDDDELSVFSGKALAAKYASDLRELFTEFPGTDLSVIIPVRREKHHFQPPHPMSSSACPS